MFAFGALGAAKEPKERHGDELVPWDHADVLDNGVVVDEGLDERPALGFGAKVYGVKENVCLDGSCDFSRRNEWKGSGYLHRCIAPSS